MQETIIKFNSKEIKLNLRDEADISVMREIFKVCEYKITEKIIKNAKYPILDVFFHAGFFSIYASILNPNIKIYALEPEKNNLKQIEKNINLNNLKNISIFKAALAGKTAKRFLEITDDNHNHRLSSRDVILSNAVYPDFTSGKNLTKEVQAYSLKDLLEKLKIKKLSLIKMDIEGGEYEIFANLKSEDFNLFDNLILEYHNFKNQNHKQIEQFLRENKFGVQIFPSKFDKTMGFLFANSKR